MNKELLIKYIEGNCTREEKVTITQWLDSDPENMREYMALRKLQDITIWQALPEDEQLQKSNKNYRIRSLKSVYAEVIKIAAVIIVALLVSYYFLPGRKSLHPVVMQTLYVPAGQRAQITLEDGTKVWLNAKTTLIFPNQFTGNTREVKIDGEGFFEVTSDKSKPFIVKTEKYDIKVWGTTFNLMAYSNKNIFETSLFEGSVEILETGKLKGVMLKPDNKISLENNQLSIAPIKNRNHFLWREGIISFENESFAEMLSKLELCFDLKFEVKNDKILNYRCTGKFRTKDGVEHILKVLQLSNRFQYSINDKLNIIKIE